MNFYTTTGLLKKIGLEKEYLHRASKEVETNQLDNNKSLPPDHIEHIIEDVMEEREVKEGTLITSPPIPHPHKCKWCHLVAKCVTNASVPTQIVSSGGQNCN